MRKRDTFDFLWSNREWTNDMIDELLEDFDSEIAQTPTVDPRKYDGYRCENVNGEVTEYVLEDGDWREIHDGEGQLFDFDETDGGYRVTSDVSKYLPHGDFEASASVNNGVLEVSFEAESDE